MNDRERIEAMLRHEKPDRVPIWPFEASGFAVVNAGCTVAEAYNKPEKALEAQRQCCQQYGWVFTPGFGYAAYGGWEFGGEIKWPSSEFAQAPVITKHPIETEDDVWNLKPPDLETAGIIPLMLEFYKLSSQERLDNEPFNIKAHATGVFTVAGNIAGVENLLRWMLKKPDLAHHILRLATNHTVQLGRYWKDIFGIDGVLPFGGEPTSANQLISPTHFRDFVLPYIQECHKAILEIGYKHIYIHICGEHNSNLPYWTQVPMGDPGFISIGHEIDIETAAKYFPNDIIVGNVESAVIQAGTPEEVYEIASIAIDKGKKCPGGFALSPGCELPPKSPPTNVRMLTKAANDFGWYN